MIKLAFFLVKYLFSNKYRVIIAFSSKIDYLCFRVIQLCEVWGIRLIDFRNQFVTHPFLSLILQFVNQRDSLNGNNPRVVNRDSWDTEIEISTSCVQDTLRIVVTVVCRFDTDLYLKTRKAQLVQVSLDKVEFMVRTNGAYRRQVYQGREECKDDDGSRCIWDLCTEKVLTWMWAQSYAYLDGDVFDESGVYFHALDRRYRFPLYLIPES